MKILHVFWQDQDTWTFYKNMNLSYSYTTQQRVKFSLAKIDIAYFVYFSETNISTQGHKDIRHPTVIKIKSPRKPINQR